MKRLVRWFWRIVPHRHRWVGFATKYGMTVWCERCGRTRTLMDHFPFGD